MEKNAAKKPRRPASVPTPMICQSSPQANNVPFNGFGAPNYQDMPFPHGGDAPDNGPPASSSASASSTFIPAWGLYNKDSIIQSPPSASDFINNVVPMGDQVYLSRLTQEQFETEGASHVAGAVAFYQHAITRAASANRKMVKLQDKCNDYYKCMAESMKNNGGLSDRNAELVKKLKAAEERIVALEAELAGWDKIVKDHERAMAEKEAEIDELNEGMDKMVLGGWKSAISYVAKKHPEFRPESFDYDKYTTRCLRKSEKAERLGKNIDEVSSVEDDDDDASPSTAKEI